MQAFRALKRWIVVTAGVVGLTFGAPLAGLGPAAKADTTTVTVTCGNNVILVLSVISCPLPASGL